MQIPRIPIRVEDKRKALPNFLLILFAKYTQGRRLKGDRVDDHGGGGGGSDDLVIAMTGIRRRGPCPTPNGGPYRE